MRFVFVTLSGPGFVGPTVSAARTLAGRGHEVVVVSAPSVRDYVERFELPFSDGETSRNAVFETGNWPNAEAGALQCAALQRVVGSGADLLVGHNMTPAAYVFADLRKLPLAIIGHAAWLWPIADGPSGPAPTSAEEDPEERRWRYGAFLSVCNELRGKFGMFPWIGEATGSVVQGDLHLLRTIPEIEARHTLLPPRVHMVGPLLSPPAPADQELSEWLEAGSGAPLVYVQQGRQFERSNILELLEPIWASGRFRAVIDNSGMEKAAKWRRDGGLGVFARDGIPMEQVLPHATASILTGHPTGVLGSLLHGKPMLLVPNGSGSDVLAARCAEAGVAVVADEMNPTRENIAACWAQVEGNPELHTRARWLAGRLAGWDPPARAADLLEAVATQGGPITASPAAAMG